MRRVSRVALVAAVTLGLTAASYPALRGGWSILTVHDLPTSLEVGRATTLTFSLRQHGEEMMAGRAPVVHLRTGNLITGKREEIRAERTRTPGVYRASFTPSEAGDVRVSVDTEYHGWTVRLLPMQAGARAVPQTAEQRGRALFVAKGCIGCHTKTDDAALDDYQEMRVGPDLTNRNLPAAWLVQKITDPASLRSGARPATFMPQLEVTVAEAQAIASYLNARTVATAR
jgi:mono/diheme cytochrome c family protein